MSQVSQNRLRAVMAAAADGDTRAAAELVVLVSSDVRRAVCRILGPGHPDVDDTVQHALIALLRASQAFRDECPPLGYVIAIARRVAVRAHAQSTREEMARESLMVGEVAALTVGAPPHAPDVGSRHALLLGLLAEIPREQAEALTLSAVWGLTLREMVKVSGACRDTLRSRTRLARAALRSCLRAHPGVAEELRGLLTQRNDYDAA